MKTVLVIIALVAAAVAAPEIVYKEAYVPFHTNISQDETSLRIVDGHSASRNQFPYQISLQLSRQLNQWSHLCGGSIVSQNWILTAAHCTSGFPASQLRVVAGILLLSDRNIVGQQVRNILGYINHPHYPGGDQVSPNDIALIKLAAPLQYTVNVQPIRIPSQGHISRGGGVLSGWGLLRTGGSTPNHLQYAALPVIPEAECHSIIRSIIGNAPFSAQLNLCTGNANRFESACNGDSGGPFVKNGRVVGVVSWVITPCGTARAPTVYAKTSAYTNWIITSTNGEVRP